MATVDTGDTSKQGEADGSTKAKNLIGKTAVQISKCNSVDQLTGTCRLLGIVVPEQYENDVVFMQRELTRRIIAQAIITAFPNAPTKAELSTVALISADEYVVHVRQLSSHANLEHLTAGVNRLLKQDWQRAEEGENDPFDTRVIGHRPEAAKEAKGFVSHRKKESGWMGDESVAFRSGLSAEASGGESDHEVFSARRKKSHKSHRASKSFYAYDEGTRHLLGRIQRRSMASAKVPLASAGGQSPLSGDGSSDGSGNEGRPGKNGSRGCQVSKGATSSNRNQRGPTSKDRKAIQGIQQVVPSFTGQMPYNFREWFKKFEMRTAGCSDIQRALALAILMDGHAANLFWGLPEEIRSDYPKLVDRLFRYFAPPENTQVLMRKFRDHKQSPNVDVFAYVNELRSLLARADADRDPVQAEEMVAEQFRMGLLPKWRKEILRFFGPTPASLDDMVAHIAALAEDSELDSSSRYSSLNEVSRNRFRPMPKTVRFTEGMKRASEHEQEQALRKDLKNIRLSSVGQDEVEITPEENDSFEDENEEVFRDWAANKAGGPPLVQGKVEGRRLGSPRTGSPTTRKSMGFQQAKPVGANRECWICCSVEHFAADCPFKEQWVKERDECKKRFQLKLQSSRSQSPGAKLASSTDATVSKDVGVSTEDEGHLLANLNLPPDLVQVAKEAPYSTQGGLQELLASYFGQEGNEIPVQLDFDVVGNVKSTFRGQPQFFADCGHIRALTVTCDTGAEQSFVNWDILAHIQGVPSRDKVRFWPTKNTAIDASGNRMHLVGFALIQLAIQGRKSAPIPVYVVSTQGFDILLGQNWLKDAVQANISLHENLISFHAGPWDGMSLHLSYRGGGASPQPGVYVARRVKIPARTQMMVECRPSRVLNGPTILMNAGRVGSTVVVPRTLVCNKPMVKVMVINVGTQPVVLQRYQQLSTACVCLEEDRVLTQESMEVVDGDCCNLLAHEDEVRVAQVKSVGGPQTAHKSIQYDEGYPRILNRESAVRREKIDRLLKMPDALEKHDWEKIRECVLDNNDVFALSPAELTGTTWASHKINTGDAQPIKCKPRRLIESQKPFVKAEIDKLLDLGWIVPSKSPWASPIVMVRKKVPPGAPPEWRMCVDMRGVNSVTIKDAYRLLNIEEILDTLRGSSVFTVLDMMSGYHQIPMDKESQEKTAFVTQFGFYEYTRMVFGLCNAPAEFCRLADLLLAGVEWCFALAYIDDIIIFSANAEEHVTHLTEVFQRLRSANLKLRPDKCKIACSRVEYLGHEISVEGIRPLASKISAIANYPRPKNSSEVASFLGLSGYYRKFVPRYSERSHHMRRLLKSNVIFEWTDDCEREFTDLRLILTSEPILRYPDFSKCFRLNTDASGFALGAVLEQYDEAQPNIRWMISCASRTLTETERRYSTTDREALAIYWAIKHFRHYLLGRHFVVFTDHQPLLQWHKDKDLEGRRGKWLTKLQEYDFNIYYAKGKENVVPDLLSRWPVSSAELPAVGEDTFFDAVEFLSAEGEEDHFEDAVDFSNESVLTAIALDMGDTIASPGALQEMQMQDAELQPIMQNLDESGALPSETGYAFDGNGVLCHRWVPRNDAFGRVFVRLVLPFKLRSLCFEYFHLRGNHPGFLRLFMTLRKKFFWPSMRADLQNWCSWCTDCAKRKAIGRKQRTPLALMPIPGAFERVAVDVVGPLPETGDSNKYILVFICAFTKMIELYALPDVRAERVVRALLDWIARYGIMKQLLSDRGSNFLARVTLETCAAFGIEKKNAAAYHAQTNGGVEIFNKVLGDSLYYYSREVPQDWDLYLPLIAMHYRTTVHTVTGETPAFLTFCREIRSPLDVLLSTSMAPDSRQMLTSDLHKRAAELDVVIRGRLDFARQRAKRAYDKYHKAKPHGFSKGDWVYMSNQARVLGTSKKHTPRFTGPFVVVSRVFDHDLALRNVASELGEVTIVSADRLKLFKTSQQVASERRSWNTDDIVVLPRVVPPALAEADHDNQPASIREFVWAKVPGYPPWPARVITGAEIGKKEWPNKSWVVFFNDNERIASVPASRLFDYRAYRSSFLKDALADVILAAEQLEAVAGMTNAPDFHFVSSLSGNSF